MVSKGRKGTVTLNIMKALMTACTAGGIAFCASAGVAAADPVEGLWRTQSGDNGYSTEVRIGTCGSAICGTMGRAFAPDGSVVESDHTGKRMIWDMQPGQGGRYSGGKIWVPDQDRTYNSKMTLSGNRLKVEGCVLGICRGQTWSRMQ